MQYIDIASLLKDALRISGCSDDQIGDFDGHSTIELELSDLPPINISQSDSGVWLWSPLIESGHSLLAHRSEDLLRFLMQGCQFARTEQMQLTDLNGMLEVRVLLAESAVADAQALADTVDAYLSALTSLYELVRL